MGKLDKLKTQVRNLPEFSEKNYNIVGYIVAALITIAGLFFIYEVVTTDALVFKAQWNMFKSPLGSLCYFIGLLWAIAWWGKFVHWTQIPVIVTKDRYGNVEKVERNYDIIETLFYTVLLPILGHFVIEPIMYGAIIYYPIQCVIAVVGAIFPYILSLIVLAIIGVSWMFSRTFQFRYHSYVLVIAGLLFTVAFAWGGYAIDKSGPGSTIQMLTSRVSSPEGSNQAASTDDSEFSSDGSGNKETDEFADESTEKDNDQFDGYAEEGLLGCLPEGTIEYEGDMDGFPIEFTIIKKSASEISGIYKNVKYGTTMKLSGESLPAMGGDISFYGTDNGNQWTFNLTGTCDNITGTAQSTDGKEMKITLRKKSANDNEFD